MAKKIAAKKKLDINRITALVRDIKEREQVKKQLEDEIKAARTEASVRSVPCGSRSVRPSVSAE